MWSLSGYNVELDRAPFTSAPLYDEDETSLKENIYQNFDTIMNSDYLNTIAHTQSAGLKVEDNSSLFDLQTNSTISNSEMSSTSTTNVHSRTPSVTSLSSSSTIVSFPQFNVTNSMVFGSSLAEENLSVMNAVENSSDFMPIVSSARDLITPPSNLAVPELIDSEKFVPSLESFGSRQCLTSQIPLKLPNTCLKQSDNFKFTSPLLATHPERALCLTRNELSINDIDMQESIGDSSLGVYPKPTVTLTDYSDLLRSNSRQQQPSSSSASLHVLHGAGLIPTWQKIHGTDALSGHEDLHPYPASSDNMLLSSTVPSILYHTAMTGNLENACLFRAGNLKNLNLHGVALLTEGHQITTSHDCYQYTKEEKEKRINRYRQKRNERDFNKKIKYACRKTLADNRPRIKGRFARLEEP